MVPVDVGAVAVVSWDVLGGRAWGCPVGAAGAVGVGTAVGGEVLAGS